MNSDSLSTLVHRLRSAVHPREGQALSDADLLRRWLTHKDEAAFELLVWRHGRLVLSVCRRLLPNAQDVEDAFQATFLVLVRKAKSIAHKQAVASWLHTVAFRIANQVRQRATRVGQSDAIEELPDRQSRECETEEIRRVLDEEVHQLPEKYRLAFILCYLEGKSNDEVARELGVPVGTVMSRLGRAKERLRNRLTRRGFAPSASLLAPFVGEMVTSSLVSTTVTSATVGTFAPPVAALVEGALKVMFIAKLKAAMAVVLTVAIVGVGGGIGYQTVGAQGTGEGTKPAVTPVAGQGGTDKTQELLEQVTKMTKDLEEAEKAANILRVRLIKLKDELGMKKTAKDLEGLRKAKDDQTASDLARLAADRRFAIAAMAGLQRADDPDVEDKKDAVELLKHRLQARQAEVKAAESMFRESQIRLKGIRDANQRKLGMISRDDEGAAEVTVERYSAEIKSKEAEVAEMMILLRQAERRLAASVNAATKTRSLEQRVAELEKQMAEIRGRRPATGSPDSGK